MGTTSEIPGRGQEAVKAAETEGLTAQDRQTAIDKRTRQMPSSFRSVYRKTVEGIASPRVAIRAFCSECVCWQRKEVRLCPAVACPLWMYRPFVGGEE